MNARTRLKIVLSGAFCSTFCPSSVVTENLPATALIQPGGTAASGYDSKVSVHGEEKHSLGPGSYFGEIALLDPGPRLATITTETPLVTASAPPVESTGGSVALAF